MSWILPVAAAKQSFKKLGVMIVVSPYNLLNDHQAATARKLLEGTNALIEVVDSSGHVEIKRVASMIIEKDEADHPDIIFMGLAAFATLIKTHKTCLDPEFVHRIFIDELHTIFPKHSGRSMPV